MGLTQLRKKVDAVDKKIIELLNQRIKTTQGIARIKKEKGQARYCPDRERQILKYLISINRGPLKAAAIEAIYREIMSSSLAYEKPIVVAYLGLEASFTHQAALRRFGSQIEYVSCKNISDIFSAVEKENADYGVVPIENTIEGAVNYTLDMLVDSDLKICAQILLEISHNLLARCSLNEIKVIYSNPQVFAQCRGWLEENLPHAERIEVSSSTQAAQRVKGQKNAACIASVLAAKLYDLRVLSRSIEDMPNNVTRFLVISKHKIKSTGDDRTSILFSIKDRIGALHDMLVPFKKYKINLTKIESRPSKRKAWDYYFFVDMKGHYQDSDVKKALAQLEEKCKFLKVLGSYPG